MLLRRLSVFAGGFDLGAAEAVVTDEVLEALEVLSLIDRLVDKSLLVAEASGVATRYRLLETICDYRLERLEEAGETTTLPFVMPDTSPRCRSVGAGDCEGPTRRSGIEWSKWSWRTCAPRCAGPSPPARPTLRFASSRGSRLRTRMGMPFGTAAAAAAYLEVPSTIRCVPAPGLRGRERLYPR